MTDADVAKWLAEFRAAGVERVRWGLVAGGWSSEKRAFAREWLEAHDMERWQQTGTREADLASVRKRFKSGYVTVAVGVLLLLIAIARLLNGF